MTLTVSLRRMPTQESAKGFTLKQQLNVKFDKVKWPNFINSPSYIARKNSISFPPIGTNVKSEKAGELPVVLGNLARQELLLWIENIRLSNCRKIQQQETQVVIQTDTFTKGWGAHWNLNRGEWLKKEEGHHCDVLLDLVPFVQFKKSEKHPWMIVVFSNDAGF